MATLNSKLTHVTGDGTKKPIGSISSSQGKISEIIISNTTNTGTDKTTTYKIFVDNDYPITPSTKLLENEVHIIPMSTFINNSNVVNIEVPSGKTVDTVVSVIEL